MKLVLQPRGGLYVNLPSRAGRGGQQGESEHLSRSTEIDFLQRCHSVWGRPSIHTAAMGFRKNFTKKLSEMYFYITESFTSCSELSGANIQKDQS